MSKIVKTLFGDNGKGAAKAQGHQNEQDRQFIQQQTQQAQALLQQMYPVMQQNTMQYGQQALDTMRGALPQMAGVRQQGTQNAIAAILGGQGTQIQPNFDFLPQELPQFQMGGQTQQQPQSFANPQPTSGMDLQALTRQILGGRYIPTRGR